MSVSQSPFTADYRECQEAAVADSLTCPSPSRAEIPQKLPCLSYAPSHLNMTFMFLLIFSFLQSPIPCLLSPLHSPLFSEMPTSEQYFLLCFITSLNPCFGFFTRWNSFPTSGMPHLSLPSPLSLFRSLWCCLQSSWSFPLKTVLFSFLVVSCDYLHNHWYC